MLSQMTLLESWAWWQREISDIQKIHLLCKVNFQKMNEHYRSQKCVGWILAHFVRYRNLPHSDVVVDRLRIDDREVDVDAIPRRNPDCPHAVLKVRILGWVSGRINCAIHGCYIPTAESWRERSESEGLTEKPTAELPEGQKTISPSLHGHLDTNFDPISLLSGYWWYTDIKSRMQWIVEVKDRMTLASFAIKRIKGYMLKSYFELTIQTTSCCLRGWRQSKKQSKVRRVKPILH